MRGACGHVLSGNPLCTRNGSRGERDHGSESSPKSDSSFGPGLPCAHQWQAQARSLPLQILLLTASHPAYLSTLTLPLPCLPALRYAHYKNTRQCPSMLPKTFQQGTKLLQWTALRPQEPISRIFCAGTMSSDQGAGSRLSEAVAPLM